jgi:hypothetical protein
MIIVVKNNKAYSQMIPGLGQVVDSGGQADISVVPFDKITASGLLALVQAGELVVNDGISDLSITDTKTFLDDPIMFRRTAATLMVFGSTFGQRILNLQSVTGAAAVLVVGVAKGSPAVHNAIFPLIARGMKMTQAERNQLNLILTIHNLTVDWGYSLFTFPAITSDGTASGTVSTPFSYQIVADNTPLSYSVSGTLPDGLTVNTATGEISGTPTQAGATTVTLEATNAGGQGAKDLTITIGA